MSDWIKCSEQMPPEHDSMFTKLYGTDKWKMHMFRTYSDHVLATIEYIYNDTTYRRVEVSYTTDGVWHTPAKVIAWQPMPEPYFNEIG